MPNEPFHEIEKLLFSLEREIDSTYCGVRHSAIYNLVEKALTILEQERIRSQLQESALGQDLQKRIEALPEPERRVYQQIKIDRIEIGVVAEQLEVRPAKVLVILQRAQTQLDALALNGEEEGVRP